MSGVLLVARAWHFAAERHSEQRRKGEAQEPYVNHVAEVAELVAMATEGNDSNLVAAAVLHDTVEDTVTLPMEIASTFNEDIASLVAEVTDDKDLPKQKRKDLQVQNAPHKSNRAKIVKLADMTSNLRFIAKSPPADWSSERRQDYLEWAENVAEGPRGGNLWIEARFDEAAKRLKRALGI